MTKMNQRQISRINELAKKSREIGLTPEDKEEQHELRKQYILAYRRSLTAALDNIVIEKDGKEIPLSKKESIKS